MEPPAATKRNATDFEIPYFLLTTKQKTDIAINFFTAYPVRSHREGVEPISAKGKGKVMQKKSQVHRRVDI